MLFVPTRSIWGEQEFIQSVEVGDIADELQLHKLRHDRIRRDR